MSFKVTRLGPPRIRQDTITVGGVVYDADSLSPLTVKEADGTPTVVPVTTLVFDGATVTDDTGGQATVTITSGSGLTVEDEGTPLTTDATTLDFTGAGVTASGSGATKTINIPGGGGGSSGYDLDTYSIDGTYGDDFTAGSLSGSWTRRNYTSGAETYQVGKNATYLRIAKAGRAAGDGYFRTAPSGDWTFAMAFVPRFFGNNALAWGLCVVDTAGTGVTIVGAYTGPISPLLVTLTTYTSYGGSYVQPGIAGTSPNVAIWPVSHLNESRKVWQYLRKSGTSYYMAISFDGEAWSPESAALTWAGTVDRVGMMDAPLGTVVGPGSAGFVDVDWFNKIA